MFGRKTDSRFNRVAGSVARGAIVATMALSLSPVSAFAVADTSSRTGITLLAETEATPLSVQGTIQADAPVEFNPETGRIVGIDSNTVENFDDWYNSITTVTVELLNQAGGTYANEIANIIEADGSINTLAKTSTGEDAQDIFEGSGTYLITVQSDTFKDYTFSIEVKTPPVKYDDTAIALVAPDGNIEDYTSLITEVIVNGETYVNGNPEIVRADGTIDIKAVLDYGDGFQAFLFDQDVNQVVVRAPGYKDLEITVNVTSAQAVWRLYNPNDHLRLYTTDQAEYDELVSLGWNGEGVAWTAPRVTHDGLHVYRLYNEYSGEHLYTIDADEYDRLGELGWTQEGVAFDSASGGSDSVAVMRLYNPYITGVGSTHHYTADEAEQAQMVEAGWIDEGVAFYGAK